MKRAPACDHRTGTHCVCEQSYCAVIHGETCHRLRNTTKGTDRATRTGSAEKREGDRS